MGTESRDRVVSSSKEVKHSPKAVLVHFETERTHIYLQRIVYSASMTLITGLECSIYTDVWKVQC